MKRNLTFLILCLFSPAILAQEQPSIERLAEEYYLKYEYARAANLYKRMAERKQVKTVTLERLAESYRKINDYARAANWYARLLERGDAHPQTGLHYADMLKCQGRYDEAKAAYLLYAQKAGQSKMLSDRIAGCDAAPKWMEDPVMGSITNITRLNTGYSDWGATFYPGGIIFMSDSLWRDLLLPDSRENKKLYGRNKHPYFKLYLADTNSYGNVYISDLSPAFNQFLYHIGPVTFDSTFQTAYFTVTDPAPRISAAEKERYGFGLTIHGNRRLELFISRKDTQGVWQQPASFPYNNPAAYSIGHAALSNDGRVLYFASDMPGGHGGTDIWYSELQPEGHWGSPQNCGTVINTHEDEAFPVMGPEGTLYYSGKGGIGMGGFDIFSTKGNRAQWSQPENMRYPVNSPGDDFHFVTRRDGSGFLTSNRAGGKGDDDIYSWGPTPRYTLTPVKVPGLQIDLKVTVCPPFRGSCIYLFNRQRGVGWCFSTDADGTFTAKLEKETDYVIRITKNGITDSLEFNTRGMDSSKTLLKDLCPQERIKTGAIFRLKNLHYDYDKFNIRPDAARVLDSLALILQQRPTMRIELGSHTDSRGSHQYNLELSRRRARSAVTYLEQAGIAPGRLEWRGYGATKLLNHCEPGVKCTDKEHEENRRTEIMILRE